MAIRLALTSPTIFEEFLWKNDNLSTRQDTAAWLAAQQLLGTWGWNPDQIETNSITPTKMDHKNTPNPDQTTRNDDDKTNSNQTTRNEEGKSNFDQTARNKEGKTNSNNVTENTANKGKTTKKHPVFTLTKIRSIQSTVTFSSFKNLSSRQKKSTTPLPKIMGGKIYCFSNPSRP